MNELPLEDARVRLEPLHARHVDALTEAATLERGTFGFTYVPADRAAMARYVADALADRAADRALPYAIVRRSDERVVGSTRFMNLEWWAWTSAEVPRGEPRRRDRGDPPDVVEIGSVWLAPTAQRSEVNTAACVLMMSHAFDAWDVQRLTFKTDARNERSRRAIERLGARFEGILRSHMPAADGVVRDTAMFSIVRAEWPSVKARLAHAPRA